MYRITDEIMADRNKLEVLISQYLTMRGNATCYIASRKINLK